MMCGINYDPLQSHDEAASGNETYSPVVMEFTTAVTGANGCETLYEIRTRKLDTLFQPFDCCNSKDEENICEHLFSRENRLHPSRDVSSGVHVCESQSHVRSTHLHLYF